MAKVSCGALNLDGEHHPRTSSWSREIFWGGLGSELDGKLYQLTWKEHTGFIYASDTFELLGTFRYPTEGWGLTNDGRSLILSDGSSSLFYYDPESFELIRTLDVKLEGKPVVNLNELEWVQRQHLCEYLA